MTEPAFTPLEQELLAQNAAHRELIAKLHEELTQLRQQLEKLTSLLFAPKSERQRTGVPKPTKRAKEEPQRGHGPRAQPHVEVVEEVCVLDEADLSCPECGLELKPMGTLSEDSEVIDFIPARFVLRRMKRKKYRCSCGHLE